MRPGVASLLGTTATLSKGEIVGADGLCGHVGAARVGEIGVAVRCGEGVLPRCVGRAVGDRPVERPCGARRRVGANLDREAVAFAVLARLSDAMASAPEAVAPSSSPPTTRSFDGATCRRTRLLPSVMQVLVIGDVGGTSPPRPDPPSVVLRQHRCGYPGLGS